MVAIDHITKLPPVKSLDAILVIMDWYLGMAHFIPSTENKPRSRSEQIAGKAHENYTDYHKR